jgi:integration host factor subunit alpha
MRTVTKSDFVDQVYKKIGFSKKEAMLFVDMVFNLMKSRMIEGDSLKISGFGTFIIRRKKPRKGRNPKTGEPMLLPGRLVATFRPSHILRSAINGEEVPHFIKDSIDE